MDEIPTNLINSIFRDAHSVKAGANLLKLSTIETLAHKL
jgi:two-component system chemotaxis sensor kinase CheA